MNQLRFSGERENFIQRRYGVRLGKRYVLAAASLVFLGVLGCPQIDNSQNTIPSSFMIGPDPNLSGEQGHF
jgi:serpin B